MQLISTHTVTTTDIGVNDNLFGGRLMAWIDIAAAALGTQTAKSENILTVKVSEMIFHRPAKVKNLLKIYGKVSRVGRTSITVEIEARRLNVCTSKEELICSTSVVMVKVDTEGRPIPIDTDCCS
jgi:acyl-CoA thioesterase YciA